MQEFPRVCDRLVALAMRPQSSTSSPSNWALTRLCARSPDVCTLLRHMRLSERVPVQGLLPLTFLFSSGPLGTGRWTLLRCHPLCFTSWAPAGCSLISMRMRKKHGLVSRQLRLAGSHACTPSARMRGASLKAEPECFHVS